VGNLHSEFGHARPLGSRVIHYVRDRRTDGRTDGRTKAKPTAPFPTGGGIIIIIRKWIFHSGAAAVLFVQPGYKRLMDQTASTHSGGKTAAAVSCHHTEYCSV